MMMPAFLIIWGSVVYVFSLGRSIVEMNVRIREGAWTRAYDGCETTPDSPTRISEGSSGDSSTSDVPLFASMILDTIFTEFHASRNGSVEQPPVLGGESQSYRGDMIWMCNENPDDYDVANFIASVWGSFGF